MTGREMATRWTRDLIAALIIGATIWFIATDTQIPEAWWPLASSVIAFLFGFERRPQNGAQKETGPHMEPGRG